MIETAVGLLLAPNVAHERFQALYVARTRLELNIDTPAGNPAFGSRRHSRSVSAGSKGSMIADPSVP